MIISRTCLQSKDRRWIAFSVSIGIHGVLLYLALVNAGLTIHPARDTSNSSSLTLIIPISNQRQAETREYPIENRNHIAESDAQTSKSKPDHASEVLDRHITAENKTDHFQPVSASIKESHDNYSDDARNETQSNNPLPKNDIAANSNTKSHIANPDKQAQSEEQAAKPDYLYNPSPEYPILLKEKGIAGTVWLKVWVSANGIPEEISLLKGSGYRLFDESAIKAIKNWRFFPAKANGITIGSWVEFPIRFTL